MVYYTIELVYENGHTKPLSMQFDDIEYMKMIIRTQKLMEHVRGFTKVVAIEVTKHESTQFAVFTETDIKGKQL